MTEAQRAMLWCLPVFPLMAVVVAVISTDAWLFPDVEQRAQLAAGWPVAGALWFRVVLGYVGALLCLGFSVAFGVLYAREIRFVRAVRRRAAAAARGAAAPGRPRLSAAHRASFAAVLDGDRIPRVMVVSPRGIGRSVMAAAYLRVLDGAVFMVEARGVSPQEGRVSPLVQREVVVVMGMDKAPVETEQVPAKVMAAPVRAADLVVRIGCPDSFPVPRGTPVLDWDVPDPIGADLLAVLTIRDDVKGRVEQLAADLGLDRPSLALRDRTIPRQRASVAAGRATIAYPALADDVAEWFATAEARLLVEISDAPLTAATVNGRGPFAPALAMPWLASVGAAETALQAELRWRAVTGADQARAEESLALVVEWLEGAGVLRPLSSEQRDALCASGTAQRDHDHPFDQWPRGLAGEYPVFAEARFEEEDRRTWEVVPAAALRVYPDLATQWAGEVV
ncbi:hypothetical protein ASF82_08585 [Frigoribacterium sp. Leaf164]|uniref:hypothetical protein n=1 Tax=Frigoribacterium sp. Leaf164 TaxID=1736282 RepID=UPI0006F5AD7B|nr:hypothetical protein [Frigoribacterium sp. Leaf164]KQR43689.1 hypothetical protein ASF82_08585 [Frigoribacterium sp. Leaf164]